MVKRKNYTSRRTSNNMLRKRSKSTKISKRKYTKKPNLKKVTVATKTSRGYLRDDPNDHPKGITSGKYMIRLNKNVPKHDTGLWTYTQSTQGYIFNDAGYQAVNDIGYFAAIRQIRESDGSGYTNIQNALALQNMNPYMTSTGSAYFSGQTTPKTNEFVLRSIDLSLELVNLTNVACVVDLYFITSKKGTNKTPFELWTEGYANEAAGKSTMTFPAAGLGAPATSGGGSFNDPHAKPNEVKLFNEYFKILKKIPLDMASSSVESLDVNIVVNKLIKTEVIEREFNESHLLHPNLSVQVFGIVRGQPIVDYTYTGATRVTYAATEIGYIARAKYSCYSVSGNAGRLNTQIHHTNISTSTAATRVINVDDVIAPFIRAV